MNTQYFDCKLYFPEKDKTGNLIDKEKENYIFNTVRDSICQELGGLTVYNVKGYYKNNQDQIIDENILLLQSYTDNLEKGYQTIKNLAKLIKDQLNQESVLFEIDNNPEFV